MRTDFCSNSKPEPSIYGLAKSELYDLCRQLNQPEYRADQIWHWLYIKHVETWSGMKNIPATLRNNLAKTFSLSSCSLIKINNKEGDARKILIGLQDGENIETVIISDKNHKTICVSCQVGCRFHCTFCASGQAGFRRNLTVAEIILQILEVMRICTEQSNSTNKHSDRHKPSHVVFMGIGEPFDNYDSVLKTIRTINDKNGINIGARKITISTCGIIPGIKRLADEKLQVELSVSLHAPSNKLRAMIMPVNHKYPLNMLIEECISYVKKTGRIITFEYTLIDNINDSINHAKYLAGLLSGIPCRVNLIPLSFIKECSWISSPLEKGNIFIKILKNAGINATIRNSKGTKLSAACGQLRILHEES